MRDTWKQRSVGCLLLLLPCLLLARPAQSQVTDEQKAGYNALRKKYFVVLALLPDAPGKVRKEHRQYVDSANKYIESLGDTNPLYKAAAQYLKARVLLRAKAYPLARQEFDTCLEVLDKNADSEVRRPPGMPTRCTVRILRAFTAGDEGHENEILTELEAVPLAEDDPPKYDEVGRLLNKWADTMLYKEQLDQAARAYEIIRKFSLWEDEQDDPKRKLQLLEYRRQSKTGAQPAVAPAPAAAAPAQPEAAAQQPAAAE